MASVKPNKSGDGRVMIGMQPGGRFTATNVPLRMLIRNAYRLQDFQIVGAPDWIDSERFDIVAKAEGDVPPAPIGTVGPMQLMMRSLLAERFKLVAHPEKRELPIYAMVLAQKRRKARSATAAVDSRLRGDDGARPPAARRRHRRRRRAAAVRHANRSGHDGGRRLSAARSSPRRLSQFVQRVVVDRTRPDGKLRSRSHLDAGSEPAGRPGGPPPPGAPPLPPIDPDGPSIFTAVQEQLGLKLDSQRGPVEVLVIDSVERPTPD